MAAQAAKEAKEAAKEAKEAKEAAKEAKEAAKAQEKRAKTPPPIADRLTFQTAIVPEGAKEGEVFYVVLQDGQPFGVACPAGAIPGQRIVVLPPKQHHRPPVRPSKIAKMTRSMNFVCIESTL